MNRLGILNHITDEELDEVMAELCAVDEYGGSVKLLTREDLIIIKQSLIYLANAYDKLCPFSQRQLLDTEYKINDVFRYGDEVTH